MLGAALAVAVPAAAAAPANDNFATAIDLTPALGPGSVTVDNAGATLKPGEPVPPGGRGHTLWYRWTAPSDISGMKLVPGGAGLPTAILAGTWQGVPFVVTLTDGGKGKNAQDLLQVTYPGFPTDVLKAAHNDVHIDFH